ncbi:MAG: DNA-directed RNA polymerase subunit alpha [Acidobacteriota bacterium]
MNLIEFQRPRKLEADYDKLTHAYGIFYAQPFERGYGITVGNALRRILLSSIEGAAITAIRIEGVFHEFSSINGVLEDVTEIILNIKKIPLVLHSAEPKFIYIDAKGEKEVTSGDILPNPDVEILDKNIHIATLEDNVRLKIEMKVKNSIGYVPAERNYDEDLAIGFIPIDSVHSPVKKVNFKVEPARIGGRADYDKLILEIWTNGAIKPYDALSKAAKIMRDHMAIFLRFPDKLEIVHEAQRKEEIPYMEYIDTLPKDIEELDLSPRSNNCLRTAKIKTIYELVQKDEKTLLETKNFGRKSLNEIKEALESQGLGLGLTFHPKLKEIVEQKIKEKKDENREEEE